MKKHSFSKGVINSCPFKGGEEIKHIDDIEIGINYSETFFGKYTNLIIPFKLLRQDVVKNKIQFFATDREKFFFLFLGTQSEYLFPVSPVPN